MVVAPAVGLGFVFVVFIAFAAGYIVTEAVMHKIEERKTSFLAYLEISLQ